MNVAELLRPLMLFMGNLSDGRARALWNTLTAMMDRGTPSVTEAVKLGTDKEFRHLCGLHANPQHTSFNAILGRVIASKKTADLVPGLWEYARYLATSTGAWVGEPRSIPEFALRSKRPWRLMPEEMRASLRRPRKPRRLPALPLREHYPYATGDDGHGGLPGLVDSIVPRWLPIDVRSDVCQDMIVAVLSGETNIETLRDERAKYLTAFWKMFPRKYGHLSLDGLVPGTETLR